MYCHTLMAEGNKITLYILPIFQLVSSHFKVLTITETHNVYQNVSRCPVFGFGKIWYSFHAKCPWQWVSAKITTSFQMFSPLRAKKCAVSGYDHFWFPSSLKYISFIQNITNPSSLIVSSKDFVILSFVLLYKWNQHAELIYRLSTK